MDYHDHEIDGGAVFFDGVLLVAFFDTFEET